MTMNQLILSTNSQFRQHHISAAICETLNKHEKVLYVTDSAGLSVALHTYASIIPEGHARTMTDLAIQVAPENKPFLAFQEWDVIITTPDYFRLPLTSAQALLDQSELKRIGLIVVDSIDDLIQQPVVKLALDEFCLSPVNVILRQAIVAMNPIQNGRDVAHWLRADVVTDSNLDAVQNQLVINGLPTRQHRKEQDNFLLRYDLAVDEMQHLQYGLKIKHLAWLDLLIVAASSPDFPGKLTMANGTNFDKHLASLRSTLLQSENRALLLQLGIIPANLSSVLQIALIGYFSTRGWTSLRIAHTLEMSETQVSAVLSALRRRVRAMFALIREQHGVDNPLARRIQVLWHMLTGIAPEFAGLAALPDVRHWVLTALIDDGVRSVKDLSKVTCCPATINIGLLETLRQQADNLLEQYDSEATLLVSFTDRFPRIGQLSDSQVAA